MGIKVHSNYSGPMNIEVINDVIIEGHLRLNGDFYLYDNNFVKNLSKLIDGEEYKLKVKKKKFYLFPYFVPNNFSQDIVNKEEIEEILLKENINNIRWDNLNSQFQRNDFNRLLMFKIHTLKQGDIIINNLKKNLFLRKKIYDTIYNGN